MSHRPGRCSALLAVKVVQMEGMFSVLVDKSWETHTHSRALHKSNKAPSTFQIYYVKARIQLAGIHLLYRSRNANTRQHLCPDLVDGKANLNNDC